MSAILKFTKINVLNPVELLSFITPPLFNLAVCPSECRTQQLHPIHAHCVWNKYQASLLRQSYLEMSSQNCEFTLQIFHITSIADWNARFSEKNITSDIDRGERGAGVPLRASGCHRKHLVSESDAPTPPMVRTADRLLQEWNCGPSPRS